MCFVNGDNVFDEFWWIRFDSLAIPGMGVPSNTSTEPGWDSIAERVFEAFDANELPFPHPKRYTNVEHYKITKKLDN